MSMAAPEADSSTDSSCVGNPDKPLGRGLADVSHLFLSQRTRPAPQHLAEEPAADPVERPSSPLDIAPAPSTLLLGPAAPVSRERLAAMLGRLHGAIESGLTLIDENVPCTPWGAVDLIAIDRDGRFTIIDFETESDDRLLLRGIGHFSWVVQNMLIVRRMYSGQAIELSAQPRVLLLAPDFSMRFRGVARQLERPRLECVRYHLVDVLSNLGLFVEPLDT